MTQHSRCLRIELFISIFMIYIALSLGKHLPVKEYLLIKQHWQECLSRVRETNFDEEEKLKLASRTPPQRPPRRRSKKGRSSSDNACVKMVKSPNHLLAFPLALLSCFRCLLSFRHRSFELYPSILLSLSSM